MEKIALIAGNGNLPYYFYETATKKGYDIYTIGLFDTINENLKSKAHFVHINIGEIGKLISYLLLNDINKVIMLGKVEKSLVFQNIKLDDTFKMIVDSLPDRKDETIVLGVIAALKESGIDILPQNYLMDQFLADEKLYTNSAPDELDQKSIEIGIEGAKALGKIDVGQTVVVKNRAIVALEAVEGTDETIKRAGKYAGEGAIIVKMSRPQQDMRIDVPAIGMKTLEEAIKIKAKGLVIEAHRMLMLDKEELIKKANENDIFITGIKID